MKLTGGLVAFILLGIGLVWLANYKPAPRSSTAAAQPDAEASAVRAIDTQATVDAAVRQTVAALPEPTTPPKKPVPSVTRSTPSPLPSTQPTPAQLKPATKPVQTLYEQTGTTGSRTWTVTIPKGGVLIIGGDRVDGVEGGVYKALAGPRRVKVSVTDGFILIVSSQRAREEFCARVAKAQDNGWAHGTIRPLDGWRSC